MFYIIPFDGFNVGCAACFSETFMTFETLKEAQRVVAHWNKWANETN
jgi:hypothetical protein